jgi:hypothetical protein
MTAALTTTSRAGDGAYLHLAFDAIGEAATIAETYSRAVAEFAAVGDDRGIRFALRQAAVALASAATVAETLRPDGGGR